MNFIMFQWRNLSMLYMISIHYLTVYGQLRII
nr:MAG TPA: hypothetical protein [Bacteriophage sp.]